MSGHGFHVHGPHDHAVEHAAHGSDDFSSNIAVTTAILATVGAIFGYMGGKTQNDAAMFKNDAAIEKTAASNKWNYFQAKSSKQNLAELARDLATVPELKVRYEGEITRYKKEKEDIKKEAEALEAKSADFEKKSDHAMHTHHQWALATTAEQVAISLAAITLLTRKRPLLHATYAVAAIGLLLGGFAWFDIDPLAKLFAGGAH